ncbi:MAG: metal ABC transporter ATP-binding protein [Eubacteriales bacterium]|nr:metal ABC transporter ATP-binding protein [Eubacteriales bacterium]
MSALIEVQGLCASYEGRRVLEDVSFTVEEGQWLCIVGENGCGKSTLIRCLLGVVQPTAGRILYGEGIAPASIGYLPQQSDFRPDFPATVREIVRGGLMSRKRMFVFLSRAEKRRADEAMEALDIMDLAERKFADLSGGQKQRVLLARSLCTANGLLVLDEPATGLDAAAASELFRTVRHIHSLGTTVVLSANDAQTALQYATHMMQLHGRVLFNGTAQQYLRANIAAG